VRQREKIGAAAIRVACERLALEIDVYLTSGVSGEILQLCEINDSHCFLLAVDHAHQLSPVSACSAIIIIISSEFL